MVDHEQESGSTNLYQTQVAQLRYLALVNLAETPGSVQRFNEKETFGSSCASLLQDMSLQVPEPMSEDVHDSSSLCGLLARFHIFGLSVVSSVHY